MKDRLTRLVNERTQMLVALSHDLRSPLTAMRLRIEMLDETDDSIRLKALVEEMQAMVEATLEFARGVAKAESTATLGLAALLVDLVGDVGEDRTTLARSLPMLATKLPTKRVSSMSSGSSDVRGSRQPLRSMDGPCWPEKFRGNGGVVGAPASQTKSLRLL